VANTLSYFSDEIVVSFLEIIGAGSRIRTDDLLITNQLLYQLSYAGISLGKSRQQKRFLLRFSR
jgi:hypothetical protein